MQVLCIILFFLPTCWKADPPKDIHMESKKRAEPIAEVRKAPPPVTPTTPLKGRTFVGTPVSRKMKGMLDCEGCSEPGTFRFIDDRVVGWAWPGSDIRNSGTYSVDGTKITVKSSLDDRVYILRIEEGGKEIVDEKYGAVFRDDRFPWQKHE